MLFRSLYFRTSVLLSYPELASRVLFSKFENVPDLTPALEDSKASLAESLDEAARRHDPRQGLRGLPPERTRQQLIRLVAASDSRAIVSAEALFGKSRILRTTTAVTAFALKAGPASAESVHPAAVEPFPCPGYEVYVGAVPGHPREVARLIAAT